MLREIVGILSTWILCAAFLFDQVSLHPIPCVLIAGVVVWGLHVP